MFDKSIHLHIAACLPSSV